MTGEVPRRYRDYLVDVHQGSYVWANHIEAKLIRGLIGSGEATDPDMARQQLAELLAVSRVVPSGSARMLIRHSMRGMPEDQTL